MKLNLILSKKGNYNKSSFNYYLFLFIIYFINHFWFIFISNAVFWDDWIIYQSDSNTIQNHFTTAGQPLFGLLHSLLIPFGPWIYKTLSFILTFLNGVLIDRILRRFNSINNGLRFFITLFFLVLPLYYSRITIITFPYTLCTFLFFFAWYIYKFNRQLSFLFFSLSFETNSILCFYLLPLIDFYTDGLNRSFKFSNFINFIRRNVFTILLPIIYYLIRFIYFKPYGFFENYNRHFSIKNILISASKQIYNSSLIYLPNLIPVLIISILIFWVLTNKRNILSSFLIDANNKTKKSILFFGFLAILVACFPYWILGHTPTFAFANSRHQLLLPLGASICISYYIFVLKVESRKILISLVISICLVINITTYRDLLVDWNKQQELINLISSDKLIKNADLIVFEDKTKSINSTSRYYAFYEWNGLLNSAFSDQSRAAINKYNLSKDFMEVLNIENSKCGSPHKMSEFVFNPSIKSVLVTIDKSDNLKKDNHSNFFISKISSKLFKPIKISSKNIETPELKNFQPKLYNCKNKYLD